MTTAFESSYDFLHAWRLSVPTTSHIILRRQSFRPPSRCAREVRLKFLSACACLMTTDSHPSMVSGHSSGQPTSACSAVPPPSSSHSSTKSYTHSIKHSLTQSSSLKKVPGSTSKTAGNVYTTTNSGSSKSSTSSITKLSIVTSSHASAKWTKWTNSTTVVLSTITLVPAKTSGSAALVLSSVTIVPLSASSNKVPWASPTGWRSLPVSKQVKDCLSKPSSLINILRTNVSGQICRNKFTADTWKKYLNAKVYSINQTTNWNCFCGSGREL